jgi:hypothetical protein
MKSSSSSADEARRAGSSDSLQPIRLEQATAVDRSLCEPENALAAIVKRLGIHHRGDVRLDDVPDEQPAFRDLAGVGELALEARVAFADQRCVDL